MENNLKKYIFGEKKDTLHYLIFKDLSSTEKISRNWLVDLSVGVDCSESLLRQCAAEDCLFHIVGSSVCVCVCGCVCMYVCVWGIGRGCVDFKHLTAYFHLSRLTSKDSDWGRSLEEQRKGVRNGYFSGKFIFSIDSQSVLPEMTFSGLANRVQLWSVLSDSCTCTLTQGLPSGPVLST